MEPASRAKLSLAEARLLIIEEWFEIVEEAQFYTDTIGTIVKIRNAARLQDIEGKLKDLSNNVFKTEDVRKLIEDTKQTVAKVRDSNYQEIIDFDKISETLVEKTVKTKMEYLESLMEFLAEKEKMKARATVKQQNALHSSRPKNSSDAQ
jgi:hypothetical protein